METILCGGESRQDSNLQPTEQTGPGFYLGANVGGVWERGTTTNTALDGTFVSSGAAKNSSVLSPNFVIGIEADVGGTSLNGSVLSIGGSNQPRRRSMAASP